MNLKLPKRPRQHVLETLSERYVQSVLPAEWPCDSVRHDYGLDMSVQLVRGEDVTGRHFSIQLKATDHLQTSGEAVTHPCKVSTANLFLDRLEPVIYLDYDAEEEVAYWAWVQDYLRALDETHPAWRQQDSITIRIPRASILDAAAIAGIEAFVNAWWDRATAAPIIPEPFNLPADLADFTGRRAEVKAVRKQLLREKAISISSGMGGIGKTALALHVGHRLVARGCFRDAQLYIDLKGTEQPPLAPEAALGALVAALLGPDPRRSRDLDELAALWRGALHGKEAVVILDNAAGAEQVRPLLPGAPSCRVLVTSRRRFELPGAERLDLRRMREEDAQALLLSLARRLTREEAARIAEACGCLPLALRVAGNYLRLNDDCAVEDYIHRLDDERERLDHLKDADDPQLDVAANIALSVGQLDGDLRQAWGLLSLFPAPFDQAGAAALWGGEITIPVSDLPEEITSQLAEDVDQVSVVADLDEGETLDRLQALRNRSLLSWDRETGRYTLHDLLRLAAARHLEGHPDLDPACLRLAQHYLARAQAVGRTQRYLDLDPDWPHLQAALQHSAREDAPNVGLLSDLAYTLWAYWSARGMAREWALWCERAADVCSHAGRHFDEAGHLENLGNAWASLGDARQAIEYYQRALERFREIATHLVKPSKERMLAQYAQGSTLGDLGRAYAALGEPRRAIEFYQQALAIAREIGDRRNEGIHLGNLGLAYADLGEPRRAIEFYQQALAISREIGDRRNEGIHLGNLGNCYKDLDDVDRAIPLYEEAITIAREIGDRRGEAIRSWNLGLLYEESDPARAVELMEVCVAFEEEIGHPDAGADARHVAGLRAKLAGLGA